MAKTFQMIIALLLCYGVAIGQPKEYKLVSRSSNADINRQAILLLDTTTTKESTRNAFNPIKGTHTVYVFIGTYVGLSYTNRDKEFHDIVVVKTDKKQRILEAYQYTLEWAEMPVSYDLYKASAKRVILTNGLSIEKLGFQRLEPSKGINNKLNEEGVLIF